MAKDLMIFHTIDACTRTAMRDPLLRSSHRKRGTRRGYIWTGMIFLGAICLLGAGYTP